MAHQQKDATSNTSLIEKTGIRLQSLEITRLCVDQLTPLLSSSLSVYYSSCITLIKTVGPAMLKSTFGYTQATPPVYKQYWDSSGLQESN